MIKRSESQAPSRPLRESSAGAKLGEKSPGIGKLAEVVIQKWDVAGLPKLDVQPILGDFARPVAHQVDTRRFGHARNKFASKRESGKIDPRPSGVEPVSHPFTTSNSTTGCGEFTSRNAARGSDG